MDIDHMVDEINVFGSMGRRICADVVTIPGTFANVLCAVVLPRSTPPWSTFLRRGPATVAQASRQSCQHANRTYWHDTVIRHFDCTNDGFFERSQSSAPCFGVFGVRRHGNSLACGDQVKSRSRHPPP